MFTWIFELVKTGLRKTLELDDLGTLPGQLKTDVLVKKLSSCVNKEKRRCRDVKKMSLLRIYISFTQRKLLCSLVLNVIGITAEFVAVSSV